MRTPEATVRQAVQAVTRPPPALQFGSGRVASTAAGAIAVAILCGVTGVAVTRFGTLGLLLAVLMLCIGLVFMDLVAVERWTMTVLLGGAMILGYGWANVGLRLGPLPIPATELLFLPLLALALLDPDAARRPARVIQVLLFLLVTDVGLRLVFDYPVWGTFAVRDATTGLESLLVIAGYRAMARDGLDFWLRRIGIIAVLVIAYGMLYPWRDAVASVSPVVGLQRPVALVGDMAGVNYAVVASGLFFAIYSRGFRRIAALVIVSGLLAVFQARSLYILMPISMLIAGMLSGTGLKSLFRLLAAALAGLLIAFSAASAFNIVGRRGPVDASFLVAHAETVAGEQGPSAGTIRARGDWLHLTIQKVLQTRDGIWFGVGLGPDLTFGFRGKEDQAVRKPHDDYLESFARTGLIGFSLFISLLMACLIPVVRTARRADPESRRFCAWVVGVSVVYLGVAGVQPLLAFPYGTVPLFVLLGMGLALADRRRYGLASGALPS